MKALVFLGGLIMSCSAAFAATWHVSPVSLSTIPAARQFRTIQQAASKARPGDEVIIHSGVYRETVIIEKSGTPKKPIRFEAERGASVIVSGLDRLTDWRKEEGDIYSTSWTYDFIPWSKTEAWPRDENHRRIGRAEHVLINGHELQQALQRDHLSPGYFYADLAGKRLYIQPPNDQDP